MSEGTSHSGQSAPVSVPGTRRTKPVSFSVPMCRAKESNLGMCGQWPSERYVKGQTVPLPNLYSISNYL